MMSFIIMTLESILNPSTLMDHSLPEWAREEPIALKALERSSLFLISALFLRIFSLEACLTGLALAGATVLMTFASEAIQHSNIKWLSDLKLEGLGLLLTFPPLPLVLCIIAVASGCIWLPVGLGTSLIAGCFVVLAVELYDHRVEIERRRRSL